MPLASNNSMTTRSAALGFPTKCPPSHSYIGGRTKSSVLAPFMTVSKTSDSRRGFISCSGVQESSAGNTLAEEKKSTPTAKPKPAAKVPVKPLPELMTEEVIPSLKSTLEAEKWISQIEIYFQDNRLEGSFLKKGCPYSFWAFFPNGVLTGPKGFSLSSYGSGASTVEPFLIDEKKITATHIVFWVEKRLAAQGIIPVWKE